MSKKALTIVFASHTSVGETIMIGSHQLAKSLHLQGHKVLHLAAPITQWHLVRIYNFQIRQRFIRMFKGFSITRFAFYEMIPFAFLPWPWGGKLRVYLKNLIPTLPFRLKSKLRHTGFDKPDFLIIDHPQFIGLESQISPLVSIYRATDLYKEMSGQWIVDDLEKEMIKRVNWVSATSEPIAKRLKTLGADQVKVIPNGVDYSHFNTPATKPKEYFAISSPIAIYMGTIDFRFDVKLLYQLALRRPKISFVLVGELKERKIRDYLKQLQNVYWLGSRRYEDLPKYLQYADVGLLPLNDHPANQGRSPMKLYEYGAASLPVAASATVPILSVKESFIHIFSENYPELALDSALNYQGLIDLKSIKEKDWSFKTSQLLGLL